jgi:glycosyltransferase involved in cell wall biosynthesis
MSSSIKISSVSIIIPVRNESLNIALLAKEIDFSLSEIGIPWECIWVDDGSSDSTWYEITALKGKHRGVRLKSNYGQSSAIMAGIDSSSYQWIVTMDGDLQNDPRDIVKLLQEAESQEVEVVLGYREKRKDPFLSRRVPSYFANQLCRALFKVEIRDLGCTLRLFHRDVLESRFRLFGEMHRVFSLLLVAGERAFVQIPTNHRMRMHGTSKYGISRTLKFLMDMLLAKSLQSILSKPLYLFARYALWVFLISCSTFSLAFVMLFSGFRNYLDTTLVVGSLVLASLSVILISIGLVAEMILRLIAEGRNNINYNLDRQHNF